MLIIPHEQFLKEIGSKNHPIITVDDSSSQSPNKNKGENIIINNPSDEELSLVRMESSVYNNFRKSNLPNIPAEMRPIIGALAENDTIENVATAFGVSKDTVGNLSNDLHSNADVSEKKINILQKVRDNTLTKLDACIDFLTISKDMKPREHVMIAESLARIHEKITPKESTQPNTTQFIFYAPERQNKLEDYEVIEAST